MADTIAQPSPALTSLAAPAQGRAGAAENYILAVAIVLFVDVAMVALSPLCRHWFMLPITICAILNLVDGIAWVRRQYDVFDPKPLAALILFQTMYVAPLIHVSMDFHREHFVVPREEWPYWYGCMACLWAGGMILYKIMQKKVFEKAKPVKVYWQLDSHRFNTALLWAIAISGVMSAVLQFYMGGARKGAESRSGEAALQLSWIMMLADPLPMLLAMGAIRYLTDARRQRAMFVMALLLGGFLVVQFVLAGLRGSRSTTVFALFMVAAIAHQRLRAINPGWILVGLVFFVAAGYYYLFFKRLGDIGWQATSGGAMRRSLERRAGINLTGVFTTDIARADIQTYLYYRLARHGDRYRLRWGGTYLSSAMTIIPRAIWPTKPRGKIEAGTNLLYGEGAYGTTRRRGSTHVYGLVGEAMMNFGRASVPFMLGLFGALMGWYRRKLLSIDRLDARHFFFPVLTLSVFVLPFGDSDNTVFTLLRSGMLPTLATLYASTRFRLAGRTAL